MINGIGSLQANDGPTYSPPAPSPFGYDNTPQNWTEYSIPTGKPAAPYEPSFLERMLSTSIPGPTNPLVPYRQPPVSSGVIQPSATTPSAKNPIVEEPKKNWMLYAALAAGALAIVYAVSRNRK